MGRMDLYGRSETRKRSVEVSSGVHMYLFGRSIIMIEKDVVGRNQGRRNEIKKRRRNLCSRFQARKGDMALHTMEKGGN